MRWKNELDRKEMRSQVEHGSANIPAGEQLLALSMLCIAESVEALRHEIREALTSRVNSK